MTIVDPGRQVCSVVDDDVEDTLFEMDLKRVLVQPVTLTELVMRSHE